MDLTMLIFFLQRLLGTSNFSEDKNFAQTYKNGRSFDLRVSFGKTVCYDGLGCFDSGSPFFHPIYRPISLPPQPPEVINTVFQLYTRRNKKSPISISAGKHLVVVKAVFNPLTLTRIIIGGFIDNMMLTTWMTRLKNEFLQRADENVFLVNWSQANQLPYTQAVSNTRVVGAQVAQLINFLWKSTGSPPERFHIIGHSLGAQVAGYAGERIQTVGRITGLDPAGPLFRNVPPIVRLDPSDAKLVDAIHSNPAKTLIKGLGTTDDNGHLDFYPGGGNPPGCIDTVARSAREDLPSEAVANAVACRHLRALEFFGFSFNQAECLFVGVRCSSYEDLTNGMCDCGASGEKCAFMGLYASTSTAAIAAYHPAERRLYLKVGNERPYCLHQYQVIVYLHSTFIHYGLKKLEVNFFITGTHGELHGSLSIDLSSTRHHQAYSFLLTAKRRIGTVVSTNARVVPDENQSTAKIFSAFVEKFRVTYLYPLPRRVVSSELCRITGPAFNQRGKVFLLPKACPSVGESVVPVDL